MVSALLKIGVNALAIGVAVRFVEGINYDFAGDGWGKFIVLALVLGVINGLVKPLAKLLSLPAVLLTLGLFLIVINIAMFWLLIAVSDLFSLGLDDPGGFGAVALGGFLVSLVVWAGELVIGED